MMYEIIPFLLLLTAGVLGFSGVALAAARPEMIATLDSFRHLLEDLGGGLGVTDPVSGPVVLALR